MADLRDRFRSELLARKRRQVAMEQMGEEAMARGPEVRLASGAAVGWGAALKVGGRVQELENLLRERELAKKRSDWPKASRNAMGLRPVSDSDDSSSSDSESTRWAVPPLRPACGPVWAAA